MDTELKKISDLALKMRPSDRLYISLDTWVDRDGHRRWEGPLTEARMLAYWDHAIGKAKIHRVGDKYRQVYAIIYSRTVKG